MSSPWRRVRRTALAVLALQLIGCAQLPPSEPNPPATENTLSRIRSSLQEASQQPSPAPAAVREALLPPVSVPLPLPEAGPPGETPFDLAVDNVPARAFFVGLVKDTPYNVVVHNDVEGNISLNLQNVTVRQVFEVVRDVYGFEFDTTDNGYVVLPARLQSKVFSVDYLNVTRAGNSTTRVNSGQISDTRGAAGEAGDQDGGDGKSRSRSIGSQIATHSEASFWTSLRATLQTIVGQGEGRSVVVDAHSGLVVVRAMPAELRDVEAYLAAAQRSITRQVILEAKIVEVNLDDAHQTGINWLGLNGNSDPAVFAGQTGLVAGRAVPLAEGGVFDPNSITQPGDPDLFNFGGMFAIGAFADDFAALIRLLSTQGDTQVLSSPRVATLNNQKAVIKVGTDEFFVTEVESTTTAVGTSTTTTPSIVLTPFFSGIALDVTPQINDRDEVILHIHPTVSEVRDQTKIITVAGQPQSLPLAFSSVRESDSIVRARNGQVVVIGGLMQDQSDNRAGATPGLADIPVLGHLFRQKQKIASRSELVILLRPMVVDSDKVWRDAVRDANDRVEAMYPRGLAADETRRPKVIVE